MADDGMLAAALARVEELEAEARSLTEKLQDADDEIRDLERRTCEQCAEYEEEIDRLQDDLREALTGAPDPTLNDGPKFCTLRRGQQGALNDALATGRWA